MVLFIISKASKRHPLGGAGRMVSLQSVLTQNRAPGARKMLEGLIWIGMDREKAKEKLRDQLLALKMPQIPIIQMVFLKVGAGKLLKTTKISFVAF